MAMKESRPSEETRDTPAAFDLTLDEFCARQSSADKRVEMIGGFYADEKRLGRIKDSEANYRARLDTFANRPVRD